MRSDFYFVGCFLKFEYYKLRNEGQDISSKSVFGGWTVISYWIREILV